MKKGKFILSILICSSIVASNTVAASANTFGYKLKGGIDDIQYYVGSNASDLSSTIKSAVSSWNSADSHVSITKTTRLSSSEIRFYYSDNYFDSADNKAGIIARTQFYITSDSEWTEDNNEPDGNWSKAKIQVNPTIYDTLSTSKNTLTRAQNQQGTITHEIGHALGLAHTTKKSSIMCKLSNGRTAYKPGDYDVDELDDIYYASSDTADTTTDTADTTTDSAVSIDDFDFSHIVSIEDSIDEYSNINELTNDSNTIIQGKILNTKSDFNESGIFTDVDIKVTNSLLGSLQSGDEITLRLHGGILKGNDAKKYRKQAMKEFGIDNDNVSSEQVEEIADGLDNFQKGDNSLFFLNNTNGKYYVTGSHQGRFKLNNNSVQLNNELKNVYDGSKKEFINDIENSIDNKEDRLDD